MAHAPDAGSALESMAEHPPSLVLVDINLPRMNAFSFIQQLARHEQWRDVPVIALTGRDLTPDERKRLEGCVEQIINTERDAPEALLSLLRKIPASHAVHARPRSDSGLEKTHG